MAQLLVGMVFPKRESLEIIIGLYVFFRLDALPDIEGHVKALTGTQSSTFQRGESLIECRSFLIPKGRRPHHLLGCQM